MMVVSKKRIKEMGKRAREKKASDLVKQYLQNSALAQVAAQCLQEADVTRDTLFSALALGKTSVVDVEVDQPDDQAITAQVFLRNIEAIEAHGSARIVATLPDGETVMLSIPRDLDTQETQGVSISGRVRGHRAELVGVDESEEYGQSATETIPLLAIGGREADRVNEAAFFERVMTEEEVQSVASTMLRAAMNDPENNEGRDRLHALMRGRVQEQAERLRLGLTTVNEVAESLGIAETEAGRVGTAGLSSRSVDGYTESYEEFTRTFRGIYGPSAAVPSFADMSEVPHEDLVRALATGNGSQLSEEFISQRLSAPLPVPGIVEQGPSYEPQVFTSLSDVMGAFEGSSLQDVLSTLRYVDPEEAATPSESTLKERVESLLKSPDVPDCVRWNFIAGVLEELTLYRWGRGRDPSERTLDAIEACREIADGQTGGESSRRLVSVLSGYNIKVTALNVSHGYSGYFPFDQVGRVPYEWQLAHLRNLIAQHNKHRLPLLLCLKERAQRIKQAPSYGQQLEGVLYAS